MKHIDIPHEILAAEIRSGHVTVSGEGVATVAGALGAWVANRAAVGLREAAESGDGATLRFPPGCCKCSRDGVRVRLVPTTSIVSRGVEYTFRFQVPHCSDCERTANRKRPGFLGKVAASLVVGFVVFLALAIYGFATNDVGMAIASLVVGPLAGFAVPYAWTKRRPPRAGQRSRYQAVYVSSINVDSGEPLGFTLAFENDDYAGRFVALNEDRGVLDI